ncbi:MAG: diguanylate cyclase response regulator [Helicobacteraceae bacterium CG2_30_36_10]|nr:MAG: diguanylate cyclase response regulator [Helicobacteraceae bacterium CG2_30_36_10]
MQNESVILIVDDVSSNVEVLAAILKDDYQIKVAQSGAKAIELAVQNPVADLILLDVEMPGMDGFEVLKRLKSSRVTQHIPVIFITSYNTTEEEEKGLLQGAVDYITKPIRPVIVKARIKTHITIKKQRDALLYSSSHDQLTGLYNRRHLDEEGGRKFSRTQRTQDKLSVIMLDLDHFKTINDTYGHLCGDNVLVAVASLFNKFKRNEDFVTRYGGEEFVILLDNCGLADAKEKAENLRKNIQRLNPDGIKISASFGVAEFNNKHKSFEELLKDADKALYIAKESGRNLVVDFSNMSSTDAELLD